MSYDHVVSMLHSYGKKPGNYEHPGMEVCLFAHVYQYLPSSSIMMRVAVAGVPSSTPGVVGTSITPSKVS